MIIDINRTGEKISLFTKEPYVRAAFAVSDSYGFKRIEPMDIENFDSIEWQGIEFSRLMLKDNTVYKFVEWIGSYPNLTGIIIEKIGYLHKR